MPPFFSPPTDRNTRTLGLTSSIGRPFQLLVQAGHTSLGLRCYRYELSGSTEPVALVETAGKTPYLRVGAPPAGEVLPLTAESLEIIRAVRRQLPVPEPTGGLARLLYRLFALFN